MRELTTFAQRMKRSRGRLGIKQKDLAERVGVTPQTISAYENADVGGKGKNPTLENAVEIAKALDVSLDWLCGMEHSQPKPDREMTLGDCARMISEMFSWGTVRFSEKTETDGRFVGDPYEGGQFEEFEVTYPVIMFTDGELKKFVTDHKKMHSLLDSKTIDRDLFNGWLAGRLADLDKKPCRTQLPPDDDGELPY